MVMEDSGMVDERVGVVREVPGAESRKVISEIKEAGVPLYKDFLGTGVHAPIFKEAKGIYITDVDGNVFMDTHAAMASITFGYDSVDLREAVNSQAAKLPAILAMGPSVPRLNLAKMVAEECAPGKLKNDSVVQFETGGSAAIDLAVKMALFYGSLRQKKTAKKMIAFTGAYHGTGALGMCLSDNAVYRDKLPVAIDVVRMPYPYCYRCAYNLEYPNCDMFCVKVIDKMLSTPSYGLYNQFTGRVDISSLIVEPIQSHGGTVLPPQEFYPMLRGLCDKYDITFVDDEICGFMWSGKHWFCSEHFNTTPDIMIIAKGFSGGFGPLGGIIVKKSINDALNENTFWHMTTYQGHPLACAAALKNLTMIKEKKILNRVDELGKYFIVRLKDLQKKHSSIGDTRGIGFMGALEFVKDRKSKQPNPKLAVKVGLEALKRGTTGYTAIGDHGNVMHWHLPLIIEKEQIEKLIAILDESISVAEKHEA